jgi:ubiquinone/menaquinone biosynthesis C-methylase UbiE
MNSFQNSPGESFIAETEGHTIHTWAKYYDLVVGILSFGRERKFRHAALDLITIEPGMNILDVGCGTGSLTIAAKQQEGSDGEVVGIDPSSNMVDLARQKAKKGSVEIDFRVGVIENLAFEADQFDIVLSSLMMHHLPDRLKEVGLQEVSRVLKPNGTLLIVELDPGAFSLASLVHGHSAQLSAELESTRQLMERLDFGPVESGSLGFRGFSYLKGMKQNKKEV